MDEIKRKLELIDAQLAGWKLHGWLMSMAPLLFPAVGLIAGILLQDALTTVLKGADPPVLIRAWAVLLGPCAGAVCIGLAWCRRRPRLAPFAYGALLCFMCLGAIRLLVFTTPGPNDVRHLVGQERRLATVRGCILTEPYQERRDWYFAQFLYADPSSAFYLKIDQVETPDGWQQVSGTIRVRVDEPTPNLRIGDRIQAYCWLDRFEEPTNPGQFNVAEYLRRRNVYVAASVPSRDAMAVLNGTRRGILTSLRRRFGHAAAQALLGHAPSDKPSEGLLQALLLGYRQNIDRDTYEAFRKTGLLHFISLSGMHVGILIGAVWWFCKTAGLMKPARSIVCMIVTAGFLLTVPPRPPTVRAAVIIWAYCLSILLRRRANALNSLSLAAIILLLLRPTQLFEAGWQLSFASVAGVLALTNRVEDVIRSKTRVPLGQRGPVTGLIAGIVRRVDGRVLRLLSTGVAAWLGGAGILLYHFYTITPLASVWTVLVFPLVAAILTLGFLKIVVFFVLPTLSALLGVFVYALADLLIGVVKIIAAVDFSHILIGHVPLVLIILYYALILFATFVHLRRPAWKQVLCAAMAFPLLVSLGLMKWHRTHRNHLSLTCLDVGHGQAILAQLPGTTNILFDAGSLYRRDVGTRIVVPFLDYAGITSIHAVVVSHHDIDHINGIPEIADHLRIGHVYANDAFFAQSKAEGTALLLARYLQKKGTGMERVPETFNAGPAEIKALWPAEKAPLAQGIEDNDTSLVSLIQFGDVRILLCSDIEKFAQQQILGLYPELKADVVVVPHHGSARTLHEDFLRAIDPALAICSCSRRAYEGGSASIQHDDAPLLCTAKNGAINICVGRDAIVKEAVHIVQAGD